MVNSSDFIAFGELLCRLDTTGFRRLVQSQQLEMSFTGGEANVAVALSQWGNKTSLISAVPANEIGNSCLNHFRQYGVDTKLVTRSQHRLGLFFVEQGAGQRGTNVIYDRNDTCFRNMTVDDLVWQETLHDKSWLHFTGTALVSPSVRELLIQGLKYAASIDVPVSFDVSYRSQLWSIETARPAILEVMPYVDFLFGSEQDASTFFSIDETGSAAMSTLLKKYSLQAVAFSERHIDSQGVNHYSGRLCTQDDIYISDSIPTTTVDRIGTGDAFAAGMIHHFIRGEANQQSLNFATAAAVLKHTIPGDFALLSYEQVQQFIDGKGVGNVNR